MQTSLRRFGTQAENSLTAGSWEDLNQLTKLKFQLWVDFKAFKEEVDALISNLKIEKLPLENGELMASIAEDVDKYLE